jgi:hypothetical protein
LTPVKAGAAGLRYKRAMPSSSATLLRPTPGLAVRPAATGTDASVAVARVWFLFAVGSLVLAGLLSLLLVVGRLPFLGAVFTDPLFFKRALVVHVDLALVVWFQAGALAFLGLAVGGALPRPLVGLSFACCGAGLAGLLAGAVQPGAQPILANYVPVIDHPVFLTGLAAWFVGTGLFSLGALTVAVPRGSALPDEVVVALRASAAGQILALATFAAAWRTTLPGLPALGYYELVAWGGGHVLQSANVATMLGLWLLLLHRWSGSAVLSGPASRWLLSALIAPHALLPVLALQGTSTGAYVAVATDLMRWTLFPVILIVLGLSLRHWRRHRAAVPADFRVAGFLGSAGLATLGLVLGACIRGSNTLVPGHYHAAIGAVTLALMAAAYEFCAATAAPGGPPRLRARARLQLHTFGVGQAVFALGFGLAGWYGLGRKQYGAEQHVRTLGEYLGLGVMGLGGLFAVAGGLLFLALMLRAIAAWRRAPDSLPQP